jgi:4-hydroxybenzoate polyprenyltransferase
MDERTMMFLATLPLPATLALCFPGGLLLGYGYFHALRKTTDLIVGGGSALFGVALTFGRLAALGAGFYLAVLLGGFALLAALAGVICAKALMLRAAQGDGA